MKPFHQHVILVALSYVADDCVKFITEKRTTETERLSFQATLNAIWEIRKEFGVTTANEP